MPNAQQRIGELADAVGLNAKTIRYYEALGLLSEPERTAAGYRLYDERDRERLEFILKAKRVGLTLEEIRDILSLRDTGQAPCEHVLELIGHKLATIDEQLHILGNLRIHLLHLKEAATETARREGAICGILETD